MTTVADIPTALRCQGTPTLAVVDNRGLVVRTVQYNRTTVEDLLDELISQQSYTVRGHLATSIDPRLLTEQRLDSSVPTNFYYVSSLSGQSLKVDSQDAGDQVALYDSEGGVIWQQDARDQQLARTFDTLHRLTSVSEWAEGISRVSERLIYAESTAATDANLRGQLLQAYSPAGMSRTASYSITGQPLSSQQQFLRDDLLHSDWAGTVSSAWDAALTAETFVSRWAYDALGQQVQLTDAKGNQQRQRFNLAGQLASSELLLAGQATPTAVLQAIDYSAAGQVLREVAGNDVVTDYVYEPQTQRLSTLTTTRPQQSGRSTLLQDLTYQYDPVGNLLAINDAAKVISYTRNQQVEPASRYAYDALYQLCQASGRENANAGRQTQTLPDAIVPLWQEAGELTNYTRSYRYDRGHNLIEIRHVGQHAYTQEMVVATTSNRAVQQALGVMPGDVDSFFDACGNLRQLASGQPLVWNARNQLLRTTQVVRVGSDDDTEVYWYDGAGQRASKLSTALTSGTTRTQRVRYLPGLEWRQTEQTPSGGSATPIETLQLIQLAAAGRQSVRVLHWELGQPAAITHDQWRYSLDDQISSSLLEVDQQADILTWEEYYPFGGTAVWSARNETETQYKFVRYSGKERDASGLYYYGFRYYAPWLGRWLNPDPAGTVDGLNLFGMVGNNPITQKDVDGRVADRDTEARAAITIQRTYKSWKTNKSENLIDKGGESPLHALMSSLSCTPERKDTLGPLMSYGFVADIHALSQGVEGIYDFDKTILVEIDKNGLVTDKESGELVTGEFNFVVAQKTSIKQIFLGQSGHPKLDVPNGLVPLSYGDAAFINGNPVSVNNQSGHFLPPKRTLYHFFDVFAKKIEGNAVAENTIAKIDISGILGEDELDENPVRLAIDSMQDYGKKLAEGLEIIKSNQLDVEELQANKEFLLSIGFR